MMEEKDKKTQEGRRPGKKKKLSRLFLLAVCAVLAVAAASLAWKHYQSSREAQFQSRLDAVLKEVYGLSREDGKKIVEDGLVYIDGRLVSQPSFLLSPGERVSCRGRGKFIFDDVLRESRKGRLLVKIKVFK